MARLAQSLKAMLADEDGQGMVEYALILAVVSVVALATLTTMGTNLSGMFTKAANALH